MWTKTAASQILREFAEGRRRVISDWRILILARRLAQSENAPLPNDSKASAIRRELLNRGDIAPAEGVEGVYIVSVPYANLLEVSQEQIVQEANPWAVFGFLTAMVHHGLTDLLPKGVYAIHFKDSEHLERTPLGTTPDDWADDVPRPLARRPGKVNDVEVVWTEMKGNWEFGVTVGYSFGVPIYVTDVERTLLDAIRMPEKCGGISKVLHAWRSAESMNIDRLVDYTDRYDINNLRQRVGFLLQKLGKEHPKLAKWRDRLQRGGSVKLVAKGAYSGTYSTDWNLSLNVPPSVLAIIEQG
jgi:predicted transcriptional regulator of viral defense system